MSGRLSARCTLSTYTEYKSETRVTVPAMSLAFICSVAKWQGCCGLACTFTAAPAKMPATVVGELEMMC